MAWHAGLVGCCMNQQGNGQEDGIPTFGPSLRSKALVMVLTSRQLWPLRNCNAVQCNAMQCNAVQCNATAQLGLGSWLPSAEPSSKPNAWLKLKAKCSESKARVWLRAQGPARAPVDYNKTCLGWGRQATADSLLGTAQGSGPPLGRTWLVRGQWM